MRWTAAAAALALFLGAMPARAEAPVALSAWLGSGFGSWEREGALDPEGAVVMLVGADGGWRFAPGWAALAVCDVTSGPLVTLEPSDGTKHLRHLAFTFGPEYAFTLRSGGAIFCRASGGVGQATRHSSHATGFAWSVVAGVRGLRRLGPGVVTMALRAQGTSARHSSCSALGATMGIALDPLD